MNLPIVLGLLQNVAILLTFSMLYDYYWIRDENRRPLYKVLTGLIIGGIGVILMSTPWTFVPGIVFDTRSILLSVSGLFFGAIPTSIAVILTGSYRYYIGGDGMWMGITVIISSGLIGITWRKLRPNWQNKNYIVELLTLGIIVHLVMIGCVVFLPNEVAWQTFKNIALPTILIYPFGTMLLGNLMVQRLTNYHTKKALNESEARYKRLHESMTDAYVMADMSGKITEFNRSFQMMLGYSDKELTELSFNALTPVKWHNMEEKIIANQVLVNGSSEVFEKEYILKDGTILPIELRVFLLRNSDGSPKSLWTIIRDISERKKTQEELIKAKEKAEENDKLKSIFLANMSHEIRTPMNAIMGFSGLVGNPNLSDENRERYVKIINSASNRLLHIIDDIIDISKIEAKQVSVNFSEFKIYDLYNNSVETFKKSEQFLTKPEVRLILNVKKEQKDIVIKSDINRLQQILDNLIENAIKYTNQGTIEIGYSLNSNEDQFLETYVKDTGIGISHDKYDLVFECFRQIDENSFHAGAGLGLSISKGFVELLGGHIWFESEPDAGTSFYFTIHCDKVDSSIKEIISREVNLNNLTGKIIIIAEDDENSFLFIEELLSEFNAKIIWAKNGKELMDQLETITPNLILLNISMPVKDGYECLKEIKEKGLKLNIIAQTAYAMANEKEKCYREGCAGYVSKPIKKNELFKAIKAVL